MKKLFVCVLTLLLILTIVPVFASAQAQLSYVTDTCGLLSDQEKQELEAMGESIADRYGVGVYVIIVNDYSNYVRTDTAKKATDIFYDDYELGIGNDHEGILVMLSMAQRESTIISVGSFCEYAMPDSVLYQIEDYFLDDFRANNWYQGFKDYYSAVENTVAGKIESYQNRQEQISSGNILYSGGRDPAFNLILLLGVPCLLAGGTCLAFAGQMKNAKIKTTAGDYIDRDSIRFDIREDRFTHRTETRQVISNNSRDGGGGGGGGHVGHTSKF